MVTLNIAQHPKLYDMFTWLNEHFGPSGPRWRMRELSYLEFQDSKDALLFSLRWPT